MYSYKGRKVESAIDVYHDIIAELSGERPIDIFYDMPRRAAAWEKAKRAFDAIFGGRIELPNPSPHPFAYGHMCALGAELIMTADGEPTVKPFASDIDEALEIMHRSENADFEQCAVIQKYLEMSAYMQRRFPEFKLPNISGCGYEGPATTAVLMRGQDFYCDLLDEPEKSAELLRLCALSAVKFSKMIRTVNGSDPLADDPIGLCDDFAALVPPEVFGEVVLPCWELYGREGCRDFKKLWIHCEGLTPKHLPQLAKAPLFHFQPSVSPALSLSDMTANLGTSYDEFDWLMYMYNLVDSDDGAISDFIRDSFEAGAVKARTQIGAYTFQRGKVDRILAWLDEMEKYKDNN